MTVDQRTVLVTGVASSVGSALIRQLAGFNVVGTDVTRPASDVPMVFCALDLQHEASCIRLVDLLRETHASTVVHLQAISDPVACQLNPGRAWQTNVAGTARVLEAIAESNRSGNRVRQFIMTSSASAYGHGLGRTAMEEGRLMAESCLCAKQRREADETAQFWGDSLGGCRTWILRPAICPHPSEQDYLLRALRGTPCTTHAPAKAETNGRLPVFLPFGKKHLETPFQFVHLDDLARLIVWLLRRSQPTSGVGILNVAGDGTPVSLQQCLEIAGQRVFRLPGKGAFRTAMRALCRFGMSSLPAEALSWLLDPPLMDTTRLRTLLGSEYREVIRYTMDEALKDSFGRAHPTAEPEELQPAT